jgi:hypothetical protein
MVQNSTSSSCFTHFFEKISTAERKAIKGHFLEYKTA